MTLVVVKPGVTWQDFPRNNHYDLKARQHYSVSSINPTLPHVLDILNIS